MEDITMNSIVKKANNYLPSFFQNFWNEDFLSNFFDGKEMNLVPAINVVETKTAFNIEVAAPGLDKKDFKIKIEKNTLEISAEKEIKTEEKDKDSKFLRREFGYTSFSRTFNLPAHADADKITAAHKDGVLTISIPKKEGLEKNDTKQIEIK